MNMTVKIAAVLALALPVAACQNPNQAPPDVMSDKPAVEIRAMQTRAFDTTDRNKTLRTIVATLQDLGYTLDKVEPSAGTVSATKLSMLRMTTTVYPHGQTQMTVRANAMVKMAAQSTQVDDPAFYQKLFFEPLSKAMFLQALEVQDGGDAPPALPQTAESAPPAAPDSNTAPTQGN